ncbi:MAG: AraC family transcriptional regulator [Rikenellaceae bacterium]|nr:AraC family transcriptional regulator [Rikenellaceae bacterium]
MTIENVESASTADVVKVTEKENSGVRASFISRTAIGYILSGRKYIHHNDLCYAIDEGSIFILDSGHHYEENIVGSNGRFEQIVFYISSAQLQQALFSLHLNYGLSFTSQHRCPLCMSRDFVFEKAGNALRNFFVGIDLSLRSSGLLHNDIGQRLKLGELLYLIFTANDGCIRRKVLRASDTVLEQFVCTIYQNIYNDISIEMLATMTNRSLTSFKKEFKRIFNAPPHRWIIARRLDRARIMLISTSLTISEIGGECGFTNISHFIKLFKQRFHTTPASFRSRDISATDNCSAVG